MEDSHTSIYEEIVIKEEPLFLGDSPTVVLYGTEIPTVASKNATHFKAQCKPADALNHSDTLLITVCRMCLKEGLLEPIFQAEPPMPGKYDTAAKIAFVGPSLRKVKKDDGYPQFICLPCTKQLDEAFKFLKTALESDRKTNEFYRLPNGVLTKNLPAKSQITTNHLQRSEKAARKSFRQKVYMAKDLITGKIRYSHKIKTRQRHTTVHRKIVYTTKDLPQKNTSSAMPKSRRLYTETRKRYVPLCPLENKKTIYFNPKLSQLSCVPVVVLPLDNVLYCLNCKTRTTSGTCPNCGPIKIKLLSCKGCKRNCRWPIAHKQLSLFCLQCQREFMTSYRPPK